MNPPLKVIIACSGLGRVRRGFESFADECFDALGRSDRLTPTLLHGPGEVSRTGEFALWLVPARSLWARAYARLRARGDGAREHFEALTLEEYTFGLGVARHAKRIQADVILYSEPQLGTILLKLRRWHGLHFRTIFSNGGPFPPGFPYCDHVQQLTPFYRDLARIHGVPDESQSLVPYGFAMPPGRPVDKAALRRDLALPLDRPVIISVAAINRTHKRIDYLIAEVAALGAGTRPYVLFLGQLDDESAPIMAQAAAVLGEGNFRFASVPNTEIGPYYQASDLFVLTSVSEAFGRVLVEALSYGLPCLAHDYPVTRFALGEWGTYGDFSQTGALAGLLRSCLADLSRFDSQVADRKASARARFSWEQLLPAYEEMFLTAARPPGFDQCSVSMAT